MKPSNPAPRVDIDGLVTLGGPSGPAVSVSLEPGQILGLVGPNGSGKSTLLRALYRAGTIYAGSVRVDGQDLSRLSFRRSARLVAAMPQEAPETFDLTVLDLVLLGRTPHGGGFGWDSPEDRALAASALAETGASHLADRTLSTLSGGEKQRVFLARALTQDTGVLVLDEPSNHLDMAHQIQVMDLVARAGRTTIVALHDMNLAARVCDTVAVLRRGEVRALGAPDEVFTPALLADVFGVDVEVVALGGAVPRRHVAVRGLAAPTHRDTAPHDPADRPVSGT